MKEIVELKDKYKFRFLVDDAHGFGTLGKTGAGTGEEQNVQDNIDIYFATFAKSMASTGAFIAGIIKPENIANKKNEDITMLVMPVMLNDKWLILIRSFNWRRNIFINTFLKFFSYSSKSFKS